MLPYIGVAHRLSDGQHMDCDKCRKALPRRHRQHMACGLIPHRDWLGSGRIPRVPGTDPGVCTICPYYSANLPQVREAAVAWVWRDKGQLQLRYADPAPVLLDLVDVYNGAVVEAQEYMMAETQRKAKHGH